MRSKDACKLKRIIWAHFVILPAVAVIFHQSSHAFFLRRHASRQAEAVVALATADKQSTYNETVYRRVWRIIAENYCSREKLTHWDKWQHAYDGKLDSAEKLRAAVTRMLASLHDRYTYLLATDDQRSRAEQAEKHDAVSWKKLGDNIGYVHLDNFCDSTVCSEFATAMHGLSDTSGLVLDLRGNHGGYVSYAQEIFAMLSDSGTFVSYNGFENGAQDNESYVLQIDSWRISKNGRVRNEQRSPNLAGNKPILVLINDDTRSAAEMLAGALRDTRGARLIGKQTFGKGVMQDTYNIGDGMQIKVVTAQYFLPSGINIHRRGIKPDIVVDDAEQVDDAQLKCACSVLYSTAAASRLRNFHVL